MKRLSAGLLISMMAICGAATAQAAKETESTSSNETMTSPSAPTAAVGATNETSAPLLRSLDAPTFGPLKLNAGIKSTNSAGRGEELAKENDRRYKLKNEYYAGLTHKTGWGLSAMAVTSGTAYGNRSGFGASDPSLTLIHPVLFESDSLKVWGQFRHYFPVADRSVTLNQRQYAYYSFANLKMAYGYNLFHQLTPRYFNQSYYGGADTTEYVEDFLVFTKAVTGWFKYGVGSHSQVEWHRDTATGSVVEVYPLVNFVLNKNVYIEPRVYLPVYKTNVVYDSPKAAALNNYQAEIFANISI